MSVVSIHEMRRGKIHAALDEALKNMIELDEIVPHQVSLELRARGQTYFITITFGSKRDGLPELRPAR